MSKICKHCQSCAVDRFGNISKRCAIAFDKDLNGFCHLWKRRKKAYPFSNTETELNYNNASK